MGGFVVEADVKTSYFAAKIGRIASGDSGRRSLLGESCFDGEVRRYVFAGAGLGVADLHSLWREDGFAEDYIPRRTERHRRKVRDGVFGGNRRFN